MEENKVFYAANVVPCELLATMPIALDHAIQDVTRMLVDRVLCELEKGEKICSLQTVEQNQFSGVNSVEIRRTVKIEPLVRCEECRWFEPDLFANPWGICFHKDWVANNIGHTVDKDGFCYRGKKSEQE